MAYSDLASLMPSASPLASNDIDPDEAVKNPEQAMAQLAAKNAGLVHPVAASTSGVIPPYVAAPSTPPSWAPSPTPTPTPPSTPVVPASVTPSGKGFYDQGQQGALDQAQAAQKVTSRWQSRPLPSETTDPIETQLENSQRPTPLRGADGSILPQYRPSAGQRIVRGIKGFAQGGIPGVLGANYGAPNDVYQSQEATRRAQVDALAQRLKYRQGANTADQTALKDISGADISTAGAFDKVASGATSQQNADTEVQNADIAKAREYNDSPEGKADAERQLSDATLTSRTKQADSLNLKGTNRTLYLANGKVPDPRQATAEDVAMAQAVKVLGHQPTSLAELTSLRQAVKGETGGTNMMVPDGKGGFTSTIVKPGDNVPAGTTTAAGMAAAGKDASKDAKSAQSIVDEADLAHQAATEAGNGNAEGDVDLALSFFKTMKGSAGSGIRFTQAEQNLIKGARNSGQDLLSVGQKVVGSGQMFTPKQRQDVLRIIDLHADQARKHLGDGGASGSSDHDIVVKPEDMH